MYIRYKVKLASLVRSEDKPPEGRLAAKIGGPTPKARSGGLREL